MNTAKKLTGLAIATAAAGMFATAIPMVAHAEKNVQCHGVNACSGKSTCKTANSSCKGQNSCKGQGFVEVSKAACEQLGGKIR
jgi:hypothetical protein